MTRYSMDTNEGGERLGDTYRDPNGEWVLYEDVVGILKERDTLRAKVAEIENQYTSMMAALAMERDGLSGAYDELRADVQGLLDAAWHYRSKYRGDARITSDDKMDAAIVRAEEALK